MKKKYKSISRINPKGGKRGCLCKDKKTYDPKCCTGEMHAQGIGNITRSLFFLLTENNEKIIQETNEKLFQ